MVYLVWGTLPRTRSKSSLVISELEGNVVIWLRSSVILKFRKSSYVMSKRGVEYGEERKFVKRWMMCVMPRLAR